MYKVVSLFCGCGGADCGMVGNFDYNNIHYDALPYELVYATDINEKALNTHKLNFKCDRVVCEDICITKSENIPDHNVLVGGFPCQSFSTVNPTKDPFDDRANLYKQMVRIAKDKQPEICIAENVKGLMTLHNGQIFQRVKTAFEDAGYTVYCELIKAVEYGVPQRRERMIMVCIRKDIDFQYTFPTPTTREKYVPLSVCVPKLDIEEKNIIFRSAPLRE